MNYHRWYDIDKLEMFHEEAFACNFVCVDGDGVHDVAYGIGSVPDDTVRFFCLPYDLELHEYEKSIPGGSKEYE